MSNKLYVGFSKNIEIPRGGFLWIDDEVRDIPRSRVFDPLKHFFNPLKNISYKQAREIADVLYTISPQGENTLTVRNGKRSLLKILSGQSWEKRRFDKLHGDEEVNAMVEDLLISPVLRRVLCNPTNFSFKEGSMIFARINRAELGDFDALVLGLLLMSFYSGQIIVPDAGFYLRDAHIRLIRERRLICGCSFLGELPVKLRHSVLLIDEKVAKGATVQDAETLASFAMLQPGTNAFNTFVESAIS